MALLQGDMEMCDRSKQKKNHIDRFLIVFSCVVLFFAACAGEQNTMMNNSPGADMPDIPQQGAFPAESYACRVIGHERIGLQPVTGFDISVTTDMPPDDGSPVGTLFELCDDNHRLVGGAGFSLANNTTQTSNPRVLSVYFKSTNDDLSVRSLGKPYSDHIPSHLLNVGNRLIAIPYMFLDRDLQEYDPISESWHDMDPPLVDPAGGIMSIQAINGKLFTLYYYDVELNYDGLDIQGDPSWIGRRAFDMYYLNGDIYIFQEDPDDNGGYFLDVCEWTPGKTAVSNCISHALPGDDWILYTLFPSPDLMAMLIMDRMGRTYAVSTHGLDEVRSAFIEGEPYQLYSSLRWGDDILMGHYPSGNIIVFDEDGDDGYVAPRVGYRHCSDPYWREAQSLAIYNGNIFVGVWPFGEIWEGEPGQSWSFAARPFGGESCGLGPYLDRLSGSDMPLLSLGQRIWSLANWSDGLAFSTSLLHPRYRDALDLLSPDEREPYGNVYLLQRNVEIACEVPGSGLMTITVKVDGSEVAVWQDYLEDDEPMVKLCSRQLAPSETLDIQGATANYGDGVWGSYAGQILSHAINQ